MPGTKERSIEELYAQDPEFPKEFIMHLNVHSGMVTNFDHTPELYAGGIQLVPQYTFVTNLLRGGVIADGFYTDKKIHIKKKDGTDIRGTGLTSDQAFRDIHILHPTGPFTMQDSTLPSAKQ